MTAANPDAAPPREFYDAPVRDLGDPATDPPLTVRVRAEPGDRHARLFDRDTTRAVKMDGPSRAPWIEVAGTEVGWRFTNDDVRDWPVVPALFVSVPWTFAANHGPTLADHLATRHGRGDMDVDSFRGGNIGDKT